MISPYIVYRQCRIISLIIIYPVTRVNGTTKKPKRDVGIKETTKRVFLLVFPSRFRGLQGISGGMEKFRTGNLNGEETPVESYQPVSDPFRGDRRSVCR